MGYYQDTNFPTAIGSLDKTRLENFADLLDSKYINKPYLFMQRIVAIDEDVNKRGIYVLVGDDHSIASNWKLLLSPTGNESDPVFSNSPAYGITTEQIINWNSITEDLEQVLNGNITGDDAIAVVGNFTEGLQILVKQEYFNTRYVGKTLRIDSGTGLTGGGDLTANRTIALDLTFLDGRYTTASYVNARIAELIGGAPAAFDTLMEIYNQLQLDETAIQALIAQIGTKVAKTTTITINGVTQNLEGNITYDIASVASLEELTDVIITDATDTQILRYDAVLGKWVNWTHNFALASDLANKVDKNVSQVAPRVIFADPTGLIGQSNFTFDKVAGQLKVNSLTNNSNYKMILGGGLLVESGVFAMNEYESYLMMSGGRCAMHVNGNGMRFRLFNNDNADFPDTSKSFSWWNKGFEHMRLWSVANTLNGSGQPATWDFFTKINYRVLLPNIPASTGAYKVLTVNDSTGEVEKVTLPTSSGEPAITGTTETDFWSGAKTFINFATTVFASVLPTLTAGVNTPIITGVTLKVALQNLQAQITAIVRLPTGGSAGQILGKTGPATTDVAWVDPPAAGSSDTSVYIANFYQSVL